MKVIEPYNYGLSLLDDTINFEDTVISSLISFAPKKLFFHGFEKLKYNRVIDTLEKIFGGKNVIKCSGCIKCLSLLKK